MDPHQPAGSLRRLVVCAWAVGLVLSAVATSRAQTFTVSGAPGALHITSAVAGSPPTSVTNAGTTYTTKAKRATQPQKVTARINTNMPTGTTLTITLTPVTGSVGDGAVTLSTTTQDVLSNITTTTNRTGAITYVFSATSAAGVIASTTRTVTFTILAGP